MIGPAGGGALIGLLSWRAIFWVNLPLIAATVVVTLRAVEESRDPEAARGIDWPGIGLSAAGLGGPVFALIEQPTHGWRRPRSRSCSFCSRRASAGSRPGPAHGCR